MAKKMRRKKISKTVVKKTISKRTKVKSRTSKIRKKVFAKPKAEKAPPKEKEYNKCLRCDREFVSRDALKKHLKMHNQALREITLLEEGHVPIESKIGLEFKGKNRIIVS